MAEDGVETEIGGTCSDICATHVLQDARVAAEEAVVVRQTLAICTCQSPEPSVQR